jgi:hypothetical protein
VTLECQGSLSMESFIQRSGFCGTMCSIAALGVWVTAPTGYHTKLFSRTLRCSATIRLPDRYIRFFRSTIHFGLALTIQTVGVN